MPQVVVHVNDRPYNMVCDEGEEEHLSELAAAIDAEVVKLKRTFGQVGDSRLLLMAALVVADKLSETLARLEDLEQEMSGLKEAGSAAAESLRGLESSIVDRLLVTADRVEQVTEELAAVAK